ncbi:hypothetical protein ACFXDH_39000 [Streptomyces sp. NPDC059467]|uniref:hypothetical protein n=1 Tax=Streptomyces sp. NPDC059467 TaxID=3346844 RepID=UPI0036AE5FB5
MTHWIRRPLPPYEEINVVFFRGMPLDTLVRGLLAGRRLPLAYGKGADWGVVLHDMLGWSSGDYDLVDYGRLCRGGGELAVFVTEPCIAKGHRPEFDYYRDGRLVTGLSFETPSHGVGERPDLLAPALTAANLAGPHAEYDEDSDTRIAQSIAAHFDLPELDLPELDLPEVELP